MSVWRTLGRLGPGERRGGRRLSEDGPPFDDWMKASQTWYREAQRLTRENKRLRTALAAIGDIAHEQLHHDGDGEGEG